MSEFVDGRTTRWSGQRDRRRAEFVDAALRAIAHYGPQTSTEQVASFAGVTRTKLYRYFGGAADLHQSIARRASDMLIAAQRPVWNPTGRPIEMITHAVSRHLRWRVDHPHLYEYLTLHPLSDDVNGVAAIRDELGPSLKSLGFRQVRVRWHDTIARVVPRRTALHTTIISSSVTSSGVA